MKFHPEIVITDIEMPGLSGIKLTERILQISPDTIIIFLSSYSDFKYAKAALNLKVFDYLLKHETDEKALLNKLISAKSHLEANKTQKIFSAEGEFEIMYNNIGVDSTDDYKYIELTADYDLLFLEQNHILDIVAKKVKCTSKQISDSKFKKVCYSLSSNILAVLKIAPFQHLILVKPQKDHTQFCYQIKEQLEFNLDCSYSVVSIKKSSTAQKCIKMFRDNLSLFSQIYFYPISSVLDISYFRNYKDSNLINKIKKLDFASKDRSMEFEELEYLYSEVIIIKDLESFNQLTNLALTYILKFHQRSLDHKSGKIITVYDESSMDFWYDTFSFIQWFKLRYMYLDSLLSLSNTSKHSKTVSDAIQYISKHYMDRDLSIDNIANTLGISVSGLNILFKKETGKTVWQVIIITRIENAAKLLRDDTLTITEICEKFGYSSISYFSKVFKKIYNISPQEYRRQQIGNETNTN